MTHLSCLRRQSYDLKLRHSVRFRISMCPINEVPQLHEYTEWPGGGFLSVDLFLLWCCIDAGFIKLRLWKSDWKSMRDLFRHGLIPTENLWDLLKKTLCTGLNLQCGKHKDHNSALWWKLLEIAAKCRKVMEQHCLSMKSSAKNSHGSAGWDNKIHLSTKALLQIQRWKLLYGNTWWLGWDDEQIFTPYLANSFVTSVEMMMNR